MGKRPTEPLALAAGRFYSAVGARLSLEHGSPLISPCFSWRMANSCMGPGRSQAPGCHVGEMKRDEKEEPSE